MICGTSMSAITLVDKYRQWFKASVGLPVRQTRREIAFCQHVVERSEDLIIPDASLSPIFADNPLVTGEPHIRFYAGTPLLSEEGVVVGSVCVIDSCPRELRPEQLEALHTLARQASGLLSQRLKQRELLRTTAESLAGEAQIKRLKNEQEKLFKTISANEARYRILFQEHPQALWVYDSETLRILDVNTTAENVYGYSKVEFLSMAMDSFLSSDAADFGSKITGPDIFTAAKTPQMFVTKDGRTVLTDVTAKSILYGNTYAKLIVAVDVTEREALRQSTLEASERIQRTNERLEFALEAAQIGEWQLNYQTGDWDYSRLHSQLHGESWPANSESGFESFLSHVHADDQQHVRQTMSAARAQGGRYEIHYRIVRADKSIHWLWGVGQFVNDPSGRQLRAVGLIREVTENVEAANRLALYERAIEAANTGIVITDAEHPDQPIIYVNHAFQQITGYLKEEVLGKNCRFLQGEGTGLERVAVLREAITHSRPIQMELVNYRKDGDQFFNHLYLSPVFDTNGKLTNYVGIQNDVTTRKNAEQNAASRALQQEALAGFGLFVLSERSINEINAEAIRCVTQAFNVKHAKYLTPLPNTENFIITAGTKEVTDLFPRKIIIGNAESYVRFAFDAEDPVIVDDFFESRQFELSTDLKQIGVVSAMSAVVRSGQQRHGILTVFSIMKGQFNSEDVAFLQGIANVLATALEHAEGERQLSYLAHHDSLTGLPNRLLLEDRLSHAIAMAERSGKSLALMFIDLNRFKIINDSLGHHIGDEVLKSVADRLRSCLRDDDTLSRQGGDEYMMLIENAVNAQTVSVVAERILHALQAPFFMLDKTFHISASIGIALYPNDARDPEKLQQMADAAMYRAKELQSGGSYQFFTPEINALNHDRWVLEHGLRNAIFCSELRLVYQPKLDLRTEKITGFEALLRWRQSSGEEISPARFIPVAESTGLILMLGEWVFREACKQTAQWRLLGHEITVAVNVSARQFHQQNFVSSIATILADTGCNAEWINIEITESVIMRDAEKVIEQLHDLKRLGISISIDDFGTGYSSLSYLKLFDVDVLKIDKSFVSDIPTDKNSRSIASAVIALAHSLELLVVAEGVETEDQLGFLADSGCDIVQGYLIGPPMEQEVCTNFLLGHNSPN